MTTFVIHYEHPNGYDVEPHTVTVNEDKTHTITGGDFILRPIALIGFCKDPMPNVDDFFVLMPEVYLDNPIELEGWFAQFVDDDGMYGYAVPIKKVEIVNE